MSPVWFAIRISSHIAFRMAKAQAKPDPNTHAKYHIAFSFDQ
jgi:hypothetical protein